MKQSEAKDFLPLIQAWAEGKTLQWQSKGTEAWIDIVSCDDHTFGGGYKYRIKPEPREWTVAVAKRTGIILGSDITGITGQTNAKEYVEDGLADIIKVREVTDE